MVGSVYERRITGNDIKEIQRIHFLEVPLMLNLNYPYSRIIGLYFQGGVNLSIPFAKTYSSSGTFTYSGFYPAYNVLLTDLPYEGFVSNAGSDAEGELKIKTINPIVVAVAGFYFFPDKQIQISVGFVYKRMLTDISDYSTATTFQLSTYEEQIRSLMQGSEKVTVSAFGMMISLRYFIK